MVVISGSGEGIKTWLPFLKDWRKYFNVLLIDNPGVGEAEYEADYSARSLAIRYQSALDEMGVAEYFIIGHSFGSFIAQHMALNAPTAVKSLILVGSGCGSFNQERIIRFQLEATKAFLDAGDDEEKQLDGFAVMFREDYPRAKLPQYKLERTSVPSNARFSYVLNSAKHANFSEMFDINTPTLIIHGTKDVIVDFENAGIMHDIIKDSQLLALDDIGHYPYMEDDSVWPAILDFLAGKQVGTTSDSSTGLPIARLLEEDKTFKKAIAKKDEYKALLVEIFTNKNELSTDQLHQQYKDFVSK